MRPREASTPARDFRSHSGRGDAAILISGLDPVQAQVL